MSSAHQHRQTRGRNRSPRPILEGLEGRPMLSAAASHVLMPPPSMPPADIGATVGTGTQAPPRGSLAADPDWFGLDFPWRISAGFLQDRLPSPTAANSAMADMAEPPGSHGDRASAMVLEGDEVRLSGSVSPGQGPDLVALPITPGSRIIDLTYEAGDWAESDEFDGRFRVSLFDANGHPIARWEVDAPNRGLTLDLRALAPPDPTMFYLGVEAMGDPSSTLSIPYDVQVQRDRTAVVGTEPGTVGGSTTTGAQGGRDGGYVPIVLMPSQESSADIGQGDPAAAGGAARSGIGDDGDSTDAPSLIRAPIRPLPTQTAGAVGGLLPAGPAVRGQAAAPTRDQATNPAARAVADAVAAREGRGDAAGERGSGTPGRRDPEAEGGGSSASAEGLVADRRAPAPSTDGLIALRGPGGVPLRVASLRVPRAVGAFLSPGPVGGRPAVTAAPIAVVGAVEAETEPEAVAIEPAPIAAGFGWVGTTPDEPAVASSRPPLVRTALLAAAAIGLGLLLPDLYAERPSLRRRWPVPLPFRRSPRPGPKGGGSSPRSTLGLPAKGLGACRASSPQQARPRPV